MAPYVGSAADNRYREEIGSAADFEVIESPMASMSTHGEIGTPAAAIGKFASRIATSVATVSPPPAESPDTATREGCKPCCNIHRYAATASSTAAGCGCSGARR